MQPIHTDERGKIAFVENKLVRHLLNFATPRGCGMNELYHVECSPEDREQFAQLIGYTIEGYGELSYVRNDSYAAASQRADNPEISEDKARIAALEQTLEYVRSHLRQAAAAAFRIHPDDLHA